MKKLPIGETVRFAYQFTFGQIGTIIGLIWIPVLLIVLGDYGAGKPFDTALVAALQNNQPAAGAPVLIMLLYIFVALLLKAIICVAVCQQALEMRKGQAFAHFALGAAELRVYGGLVGLLALLLIFSTTYLVGLNAAYAFAMAQGITKAGGGLIGGALVLIVGAGGFCALFYAMVRLSFLLVPAALSGGEFGLARSWILTRNNFWRILAVGCGTVLPLLVFQWIVNSIIFRQDTAAMAGETSARVVFTALLRANLVHMPIILGVEFLIAPLTYGLVLAPAVFAYRILTEPAD